MPTGRGGACSAVLDGKLYVIGGGNSPSWDSTSTTVEIFNPVSNSWTSGAPLHEPRTFAGCAVVNGKIYVIGGSNAFGILTSVEEYNPVTDRWVYKSPMPTNDNGYGEACVAYNNKIYVFLPYNTYQYDVGSDSWVVKAPIPRARANTRAALVGDSIYLVGGFWYEWKDYVDAYYPNTNTWQKKTSLPSARGNIFLTALNDQLYAIGGRGEISNTNLIVERYDPATDTWATDTPLNTGHWTAAGSVLNNKIIVCGGYDALTTVECGAKTDPEWSFVQMTDTHIGYSEKARTNLVAVLNKVLKEVKPKFIVNTGDVADTGCSCAWGTCNVCNGNYSSYLQTIAPAQKAGIPLYSLLGNHDRRTWSSYLKECNNDFYCFADALQGHGGCPYRSSFEQGNIMFVTLDTGSGNCEGALTTEDVDFLNGLDKQVPKIILTHHPAVADDSEITWLYTKFGCNDNHIVENQQDFINYCEEPTNNVCIVLSGHTHKNHVYDKNLGVPTDYPLYIQTGSVGKPDDKYPVFMRVDVASPPIVQPVTQLTAEDYYYISAKIYPSENLQVYDSNGNRTGYDPVSGSELGIPHSVYFSHYVTTGEDGNIVFPEEVLIFDPCDNYIYEVVGADKGTYGLKINLVIDDNEISAFEANGIPTSLGEIHDFIIDWNSLSEGEDGVRITVDRDGDGEPERVITSDSNLTAAEFDAPMSVIVIIPSPGDAVQDGITLTAEANDEDGIDEVYFYIREPNEGNGVPIGQEDLPATFNSSTGKWELNFDTTQLPDGYYVVLAKAIDSYGNEGWSQIVPFSIRNWAIITLLPATENNKAGRTMPVKFAIRIAKSVDPAMPFVYNDDLEIRIYKSGAPTQILQRSLFGTGSTDYRIDTVVEKYMTNFKTLTTPATYVVEIWRPTKNFKVGSFTFATTNPSKVAAPSISPKGGTFTSSQQVTLSCSTSDAEIHYTTDGNEPTSSSTQYTTPFTVSSSRTVKARGFKADYTDSDIASAIFVLLPVLNISALDNQAAETVSGETANTGTFRISRVGNIANALTVSFSRTGTATYGTTGDYTLSANGAPLTVKTVVISAGSDHVDITVSPNDNLVAEPNETVILTLMANASYTLTPTVSQRTATVTILDNEPTLSITAFDNQAAETVSGEPANVGIFRISRVGNTADSLTVYFSRTGTATFGATADYTLSGNGLSSTAVSAVIPAGQEYVDITVTPRDSLLHELTETIVLTLRTSVYYNLTPTVSQRIATMTIIDNDP
jgi:N-acetylneuraminic acid mutarotase/predicted phosphodiesterase